MSQHRIALYRRNRRRTQRQQFASRCLRTMREFQQQLSVMMDRNGFARVTDATPVAVTVNGEPVSGPIRWDAGDPMEIRIESRPTFDSMTLFHNNRPLPQYDSPIADTWQWGGMSGDVEGELLLPLHDS